MKKRVFAISMAGLTAASALLSGCGASGNAGASGTDSLLPAVQMAASCMFTTGASILTRM